MGRISCRSASEVSGSGGWRRRPGGFLVFLREAAQPVFFAQPASRFVQFAPRASAGWQQSPAFFSALRHGRKVLAGASTTDLVVVWLDRGVASVRQHFSNCFPVRVKTA